MKASECNYAHWNDPGADDQTETGDDGDRSHLKDLDVKKGVASLVQN